MPDSVRFRVGSPVFHTADPSTAISFYKDMLGFDVEYDDGYYTVLRRDDCRVDFVKEDRSISGIHLFFLVEDLDTYFSQVEASGVEILRKPDDQPYGLREFSLRDPNGTEIIFGQEIKR